MPNNHLLQYTLQLADNTHLLGHRLGEWCGHAPNVEIDIALTNIALDLIGQARAFYQYAAQLEGKNRTEDDLAYLRLENQYHSLLLVEQPNEDFAETIARNFYYDSFAVPYFQALCHSTDNTLSAIAQKAIKEARYHLRFTSEWVIRLGDGTPESHTRMQNALNQLWQYTGELFTPSQAEAILEQQQIAPNLLDIQTKWLQTIQQITTQATLTIPSGTWFQKGGKQGNHTEHLGYMLADIQHLQRTYPGAQW